MTQKCTKGMEGQRAQTEGRQGAERIDCTKAPGVSHAVRTDPRGFSSAQRVHHGTAACVRCTGAAHP